MAIKKLDQKTSNALEMAELVAGRLANPHGFLGAHPREGTTVVRAYRPDASAITVLWGGGQSSPMQRVDAAGVFEAEIAIDDIGEHRFRVERTLGDPIEIDDPYRFWPTLGDIDLHLIGEGRHEAMWKHMGAHPREHQGVSGTSFAVWAPDARSVSVVGDFNSWDGRFHPMRSLGASGIWEVFIPGTGSGDLYKFEILTRAGATIQKGDPVAFHTERPPGSASAVFDSAFVWTDDEWLLARTKADQMKQPMSIYECHIGSWRKRPEEKDRSLTYRELAHELGDYLVEMGFTHVEFLPVSEHPFRGSWGYQVSAYYAPSSRFGTPDDFKYMVDVLHSKGIGVLVDWVPAHFPKDQFALSRFDGTALYEHADPRQGEHPDWGTLVFNLGRHEVRNFLMANALFWVEEFHVDGLRVDAVASMLYLDYSRKPGEWVPNRFGGRENLDSVSFLKEVNAVLYGKYPGVMTIAEESTSWPGVSRPTHLGGLGFGYKWNLGWMHDTLNYFAKDSVYRRYHHNNLTFGMLYQWHENFVLPLSHDEVVHGKGSLYGKMPGDHWQKLANLRALFAWMWAHPGKQLLFMGCEFGQQGEWSHDRSLDWHLLDDPGHSGVQDLVKSLNRLAKDVPALSRRDFDPEGFRWIDANDSDNNVLSFLRFSDDTSMLACIANLSPLPHEGYRIGLPSGGTWRQVLNTDWPHFGGSGVDNQPAFEASGIGWHGLDQSIDLTLPPLGVIWLIKD